MFCSTCGNQVAENALFCPNCGAKLAGAPAPQEPAPQAPAPQAPAPEGFQPVVPEPFAAPEPQQYYQQPQQDFQQAYQQPQQDYQQAYQQPQQAYQQPYQQPYQPQPVVAKKSSGKKGLLIAVSCFLVAVIGFGVWWFLLRDKGSDGPLQELEAAADRSIDALDEYTGELPNLNAIVRSLQSMDESDVLRLGIEMLSEVSYSYGEGQEPVTYSGGLRLNANLDIAGEALLVSGTYSGDGVNQIPFSVYLDREQLQIASTALLEEGEALSMPLKDLPSQWNSSALGKLSGYTMPEDLDLSGLMNTDLEKGLKNAFGEDWEKFEDSVEMVPFEGKSHFTGEGKTYTLTWDKTLLHSMADKASKELEALEDLSSPEEFFKLDFSDITAKALVVMLEKIDEALKDVQIYQVEDAVYGFWISIDDGNEPKEVEMHLLGQDNPWEHVTVATVTQYSDYTVTETYDIQATVANGQLRIDVTLNHNDTDGAEYCYTEGPYTMIYNDADGKITFEEDGEPVEGAPEARLVPEDGGMRFEAVTGSSVSDYYSYKTTETITLSGKAEAVKPISTSPIEVLKLSEQELQELYLRIRDKVGNLFGGFGLN